MKNQQICRVKIDSTIEYLNFKSLFNWLLFLDFDGEVENLWRSLLKNKEQKIHEEPAVRHWNKISSSQ